MTGKKESEGEPFAPQDMKPKYRVGWVLAAIAVPAVVGYYFWSAMQNPPPPDKITVTFADFAGDAPSIIAYAQGFFREEGLAVTFKPYNTGVQSRMQLAADNRCHRARSGRVASARTCKDALSFAPPAQFRGAASPIP